MQPQLLKLAKLVLALAILVAIQGFVIVFLVFRSHTIQTQLYSRETTWQKQLEFDRLVTKKLTGQ